MRQTFLLCLGLLTLGTGCTSTVREPAPAPAVLADQPARIMSGVDSFARLRSEYGDREDFHQACESDRPDGMRRASQLADAGDWQRVLAIAEPWLQTCPVDITAREMAAAALMKLDRKEAAAEQIRWYRGLIESILASGDGRTPNTAYLVISIAEEYSVMRALQLRPTEQALLDGGIDAFSVESDAGTDKVYFNPAAHFRRLSRAFGEADRSKPK